MVQIMAKKDVVVQSNRLIMLDRYDWTLQEQKVFLFLISRIDSIKDKDFRTITIAVKEFADMVGISNRGSIYQELEKVTKRLLGRVFCFRTENETIQFQALSETKYQHKEGEVKLTIHKNMKPYLLEISKNFTAYELKNISKMTSSYALRIYELIKMFEGLGEIIYGIDDLRKKLGIKEGELSNFAYFNRRVLEISRREINSKTDLKLEYEPIKEGRKVTQIKFKFKHINSKKGSKVTIKPKLQQLNFVSSGLTAVNDVASRIMEDLKPAVINNHTSESQSKIIKYADLKEELHDQNAVDNKKETQENVIQYNIKTENFIPRRTGFMKIFDYLFNR
jgi:plasmid replication initiation protein